MGVIDINGFNRINAANEAEQARSRTRARARRQAEMDSDQEEGLEKVLEKVEEEAKKGLEQVLEKVEEEAKKGLEQAHSLINHLQGQVLEERAGKKTFKKKYQALAKMLNDHGVENDEIANYIGKYLRNGEE